MQRQSLAAYSSDYGALDSRLSFSQEWTDALWSFTCDRNGATYFSTTLLHMNCSELCNRRLSSHCTLLPENAPDSSTFMRPTVRCGDRKISSGVVKGPVWDVFIN